MTRTRSSSAAIRRIAAAVLLLLAAGGAVVRAQDNFTLASTGPNPGPNAEPNPGPDQSAPAAQGQSAAPAAAATNQSAATPAQPDAAEPPEPYTSYTEPAEPGIEGLDRARSLPENAFGQTPFGLPYSSVLTTTGANADPLTLMTTNPFQTGYEEPTKIGGAEGSIGFNAGGGNLLVPFVNHGTEPDNADIKAGPFYIKFHSADGLVLYTDNKNLTNNSRQTDLLVLLRLNLSIIAQLADNLQFAVSGSLCYLPLTNSFGIESSLVSSLGLLAGLGPIFGAQFVYDTVIAGWPVRFADDFQVGTGSYSDSPRDNFDLFNGDYLQRDADDRYTFHAGRTGLRDNGYYATNEEDASLIYYSNTVSALTERLLPGDVRLTMRLDHQDFWYNQNNRGLPSSRDDFYAALISQRENQRFKPYAIYDASYVQGYPGITQTIRAGVFGPIDDQLFMRADAGYYINANDHNGATYTFTLNHTAGPYTTEELTLDRTLSYFNQEQWTTEYYRLNQTLGPTLYATLFLAHSDVQELINDGSSNYSDDIGGLQLVWYMGPKTTLWLSSTAEQQRYDNGIKDDTITARAALDYNFTDSLSFQLLYQYQRSASNNSNYSYYENLVYFRVVKLLE